MLDWKHYEKLENPLDSYIPLMDSEDIWKQ